MPAPTSRWPGNLPGLLAYFVVGLLAVLYFLHRAQVPVPGMPPFWDARVYVHALEDWKHGADPYLTASPSFPGMRLPFLSPPLFLYLMAFFGHLIPGRIGITCYCALACVAALALPALLAHAYIRSRWMSAALCLFIFIFQPEKHGSQALLSGNLSNVLYLLVLAAGVPGLRRSHWLPFYGTILFAGVMKPTFLAFLLLPLLAGRKQWLQSAATALGVLAGDLAQRATLPVYWHEFQQNVYLRVFVHGDDGFGLLGLSRRFGSHVPLLKSLSPSVNSLLVVLPLLVLLMLLRNRRFGQPAERLWIPCLVVFAVLSNPRILDYDADLAVLPAIYIVVEFARSLPPGPWRGLQIGAPMTLFTGLLASQPNLALCLLLTSSVLLVLVQLLWPRYFVSNSAGADAHDPATHLADTRRNQPMHFETTTSP